VIDPAVIGPDKGWFLAINEWAQDTPWLHGVIRFYASYGVVLFAGLLVAGYVVARRQRSATKYAAAFWAGLGTLLAVAVNQPIASDVGEPRPFAVFPHALVLVHRSTDPSFASDHATMAGAVAVGLFLVSRRLGVVAAVAALLMSFARVYVGAHYPVDVAAGLALGATVVLLGWFVVRRPLTAAITALQRHGFRWALPQ
jgi:membrane-associated phospholipid phosphatase